MDQPTLTTGDQGAAGAPRVTLTIQAANALDDIRWTSRSSGAFIGSKYPAAVVRELVIEGLVAPLDHSGSVMNACRLTDLGRAAAIERL